MLERALVLGDVHWSLLLNAAYLAVMGVVGLRIATRRLGRCSNPDAEGPELLQPKAAGSGARAAL